MVVGSRTGCCGEHREFGVDLINMDRSPFGPAAMGREVARAAC
jgi:hypothetical protein